MTLGCEGPRHQLDEAVEDSPRHKCSQTAPAIATPRARGRRAPGLQPPPGAHAGQQCGCSARSLRGLDGHGGPVIFDPSPTPRKQPAQSALRQRPAEDLLSDVAGCARDRSWRKLLAQESAQSDAPMARKPPTVMTSRATISMCAHNRTVTVPATSRQANPHVSIMRRRLSARRDCLS